MRERISLIAKNRDIMKEWKLRKIVVYDTRVQGLPYYTVEALCVDNVFALFEMNGAMYIASSPDGYWEIVATYDIKLHNRIRNTFSDFIKYSRK